MELIDREKIEWYGCNFETPECESENRKCSECSHAECSHAQVMQLPSIKVKDNPTNGDVIKAMFPQYNYEEINYKLRTSEDEWEVSSKKVRMHSEQIVDFESAWWNAPYKGVEE